jgi:hypothetical protein
VLVVGTDDWAIEQSATGLGNHGHQVLRCHEPGEPPFPCNALRPGRQCPLDAGIDVVVTARARPTGAPATSEIGLICALHAGHPLVVTGISAEPYAAWASRVVSADEDVASACEGVVDVRRRVIHLSEGA